MFTPLCVPLGALLYDRALRLSLGFPMPYSMIFVHEPLDSRHHKYAKGRETESRRTFGEEETEGLAIYVN